jgi:hypothetical protein
MTRSNDVFNLRNQIIVYVHVFSTTQIGDINELIQFDLVHPVCGSRTG